MSIPILTQEKFKVESVVELGREVAGTQSAEGRLLVRERLGPGTPNQPACSTRLGKCQPEVRFLANHRTYHCRIQSCRLHRNGRGRHARNLGNRGLGHGWDKCCLQYR